MLERLLRKVAEQQTGGSFTFSVVVADNDESGSARAVVEKVQKEAAFRIAYHLQPIKNIALTRNTAVLNATGDYIAFIDDDEFPGATWLLTLLETIEKFSMAGVLAPVVPHFEREPPQWVRAGKFYERPRHPTGFALSWAECRTGNVLFRRSILLGEELPFLPEFGTGGEDQDFFRRMVERGHRFIWCDEAGVWETVPPERWDKKIMLNRALLRGRNSLRHENARTKNLLKSAIAFPLYSVALPFLRLAGEHHYIKYLVKTADHAGRLLASLNLNPVKSRVG